MIENRQQSETINNIKTPATSRQRKDKRVKIAIIVVIGVIMFATGIAVGFVLFGNRGSVDNSLGANSEPVAAEKKGSHLSPKGVISGVKDIFKDQYKLAQISADSRYDYEVADGELAFWLSEASPTYKPEDINYYVSYEGGSAIGFNTPTFTSGEQMGETLRSQIIAYYKGLGLKKQSESAKEWRYVRNGLVCSIEPPELKDGTMTYASCGLIERYRESVKKLKPFAEALNKASDMSSSVHDLSYLQLSKSLTPDYQLAKVRLGDEYGGGAAGLFYKKGPDEQWRFFTAAQSVLNCDEYNTEDLKKAYKGEPCGGGSGRVGMSESSH